MHLPKKKIQLMSEMALDEIKLFTMFNKFVFQLVCSFEEKETVALPYKTRNCLAQEERHHFQIAVFLGM